MFEVTSWKYNAKVDMKSSEMRGNIIRYIKRNLPDLQSSTLIRTSIAYGQNLVGIVMFKVVLKIIEYFR